MRKAVLNFKKKERERKRFFILESTMTDNVFYEHFLGEKNTNAHSPQIGTNADHSTKIQHCEKYESMELLTHPGEKLLQELG